MESYLRSSFEAFQSFAVPLARGFTPVQKDAAWALIWHQLAPKPKAIAFSLAAYFFLIDLYSLLTSGHRFRSLADARKQRVLNAFFDSPVPIIRKGFWGVNTLAKLGVYGQESVYPSIHYTKRKMS